MHNVITIWVLNREFWIRITNFGYDIIWFLTSFIHKINGWNVEMSLILFADLDPVITKYP